MAANSEGKGCLASLIAVFLFASWSGALMISLVSAVISPPALKAFTTMGLKFYVKEELKTTDDVFFKTIQDQARKKESIKAIKEFKLEISSKDILNLKSPDELYKLISDRMIDPVCAKDASTVTGTSRLDEILKEITQVNPKWEGKNLFAIQAEVRRWFNIFLMISLGLVVLFVLLSQGSRRLRGPGIVAFLAALPLNVTGFAVSRGEKWLKEIDLLENDFPHGLFVALSEVFNKSLLLSQISMWAGLALIILSFLVARQMNNEKEDSYSQSGPTPV